ncbi:MAG: hypothetical protein HYY37_05115 [Candidatus Aenigmarchaeota archaeon]|nr:hypothetical protein [Candidatus Aenigmarchaeota archaeon]
MKALLRDVAASLAGGDGEDGDPFFHDAGYEPFPLDDAHFQELVPRSDGKLWFVDGGNAELAVSGSRMVSLIRLFAYSCVNGQAEKKFRRAEFFCIAQPVRHHDTLLYAASYVPVDVPAGVLPQLALSPADPTIREGVFSADLAVIPGIARRFAEWLFAAHIVEREGEAGDVLVRDGTLQAGITGESAAAERLYRAAQEKQVTVAALSKTTKLFTSTGKDLLGVLYRRGSALHEHKPWAYHPIADSGSPNHRAALFAAKLHGRGQHAFRIDVLREQAGGAERALALIAGNSNDRRFLGYPFGLIAADNYARVTSHEKNYYRSVFAGRDDPHELLNRLVS